MTGLLALGWVVPAAAQDTKMPLPAGCTPVATVHKSACQIETHYRCGSDWWVLGYVNDMLVQTHVFEADWGLIGYEFVDRAGTAELRFVEGSGRAMSFAELVESGTSPASGKAVMNSRVVRDRTYILSGETRLTGETLDVGGVPFRKGVSERLFEVKPGGGGLKFEIDIYVSEELSMMIEGDMRRWAFGTEAEPLPGTPVSLRREGQTGFLATTSEFCGE